MIVREIPVFEGWLINKKNVYMAKSIDEFKQKIEELINGEIQSLSEEAYNIAIERKSENIGKKLKETYNEVLEGKNKNENRIIY